MNTNPVSRRCLLLPLLWLPLALAAKTPTIRLVIENHLFTPSELSVPANQKVRLMIVNKDATPEEFESYQLNREKVVLGNSKTIIYIGPLAPGVYPFFGEFNPKTAQGTVRVK